MLRHLKSNDEEFFSNFFLPEVNNPYISSVIYTGTNKKMNYYVKNSI